MVHNLGRAFEYAHSVLAENAGSAVTDRIGDHIGLPALEASIVEATWPTWAHASVHLAVQAHLEAHPDPDGAAPVWFGLSVSHHQHQDLASVLDQELRQGRSTLSRPTHAQVAVGHDRMLTVVQAGLVTSRAPSGEPVVLVLRFTSRQSPAEITLEVVSATPEAGQATLEALRTLVDSNDLLRGQVVTFGMSEHYGNELVSFMPRPDVAAEQVILPEGVLDEIVDHVIGIGASAQRLGEYGLHLKRGVLLYGPPGTGKTHTVRHLIGRAPEATVVVLTGGGLRFISPATALARRLTPSIVVCEDVDLVAQDRSYTPEGNPLLFTLLDAMDGVSSDADVTFILTTNRASELEEALVQRPGRVDLAVEVPRPDQAGREALLRLYAAKVPVTADLSVAAERLEGVTASAMKEVMRRAGLAALRASEDSPEITDEVLDEVVSRFLDDSSMLTRSLLGTSESEPGGGEFGLGGGPRPGLYPTDGFAPFPMN